MPTNSSIQSYEITVIAYLPYLLSCVLILLLRNLQEPKLLDSSCALRKFVCLQKKKNLTTPSREINGMGIRSRATSSLIILIISGKSCAPQFSAPHTKRADPINFESAGRRSTTLSPTILCNIWEYDQNAS